MNEYSNNDCAIDKDLKVSYNLINTAQQTLSDLDKSIIELSMLVENLKLQSAKLSNK